MSVCADVYGQKSRPVLACKLAEAITHAPGVIMYVCMYVCVCIRVFIRLLGLDQSFSKVFVQW